MSFTTEFATVVREAPAPEYWGATLIALVLGVAGVAWAFTFLKRKRMIEDTPTALIRSAPQGYVELQGLAQLMDGDPVHAPLSNRACVWYRYKVERREKRGSGNSNQSWRVVEQGVSDNLFSLEDRTGQCAVDPDGAAVTPAHRHVWYGTSRIPGRYHDDDGTWWARGLGQLGKPFRYTEARISPGDAIYALGTFHTHGGAATKFDAAGAIGDKLREWKRDRDFMLRNFDADGDGEIDVQEWEAARARAEREVMAENAGNAGPPPVDLLSKPASRRQPFIIAAGTEEEIVTRCRYAAGALLVLALPLVVGALWSLVLRV